jgi:XTP/dITP diphosphohydrolase
MHHLFLATRNPHKTRELAAMLGAEYLLEDLRSHPEIEEIVEDGATFAENARFKARAVSQRLSGLVLADDSGLEVDSLGGDPGVRSARFAGDRATDAENRSRLLRELAKLPEGTSWAARFRCVLALAHRGEVVATFEGLVEGEIASSERGTGGFGYDPLFRPRGREKTFAEMSPDEKDRLSHRGAAVEHLRRFFRTF